MCAQLLHFDKFPLQVLLRKIKIKDPELITQNQQSMQKPVAKLLDYYLLSLKKKRIIGQNVQIGSEKDCRELGPIRAKVGKGQWYDYRKYPSRISVGQPYSMERYPKCLRCDAYNAMLIIIGQNGVITVSNTVAVIKEPVIILRKDARLLSLTEGMQCIKFGPGIYFILKAFGATIIIEGKGNVEQNELYFICMRGEFLGFKDPVPVLMRPMLFVFTGKSSEFYIVQMRQRLFVIDSKKFHICMRDKYWFLEFNFLIKFHSAIVNQELDIEQKVGSEDINVCKLPKEIVAPNTSASNLGHLMRLNDMFLDQGNLNPEKVNIYQFIPKMGRIIIFGNSDSLWSSFVLDEGKDCKLTLTYNQQNTYSLIMTGDCLKITNGPNDHIRTLAPGRYTLDENLLIEGRMDRNHIILVFKNGFILLTGFENTLSKRSPEESPIGSPEKSRIGSPVKSRIGSPEKSRIGSPVKSRIGSPVKTSPKRCDRSDTSDTSLFSPLKKLFDSPPTPPIIKSPKHKPKGWPNPTGVERLPDPFLLSADFKVYGTVQGVNFRKFMKQKADELGLVGWCKNRKDGAVVGTIQGPEKDIDIMKDWLSSVGSPLSNIRKCIFDNQRYITKSDYNRFDIRKT